MRNLIYIALVLFLISCGTEPKEIGTDMLHFPKSADGLYDEDMPTMEFVEQNYLFDKIIEGTVLKHVFQFTNTGNSPLVITAVEPTCGCTVAKNWPKKPIQPGEDGEITVEFDSKDRVGFVTKTISIIANTAPSKTIISYEGEVVGPETKLP